MDDDEEEKNEKRRIIIHSEHDISSREDNSIILLIVTTTLFSIFVYYIGVICFIKYESLLLWTYCVLCFYQKSAELNYF